MHSLAPVIARHLPQRDQPRLRHRTLGLLLAVFALLGQLSAALAMPMPDEEPSAASGWTFPICHTDSPANFPGDPAPPAPAHHHHGMDCALCPLCAALAAAVLLAPPGPPVLPGPAIASLPAAAIPPARAPPLRTLAAATYPTGPPALS